MGYTTGRPADVAFGGGGSVRTTIASNAGRGNDGASLECVVCYLISDAIDVRVKVGSACELTTGIPVPIYDTSNRLPLRLEVDDVSKLYFYGATNGKVIDVLYLK